MDPVYPRFAASDVEFYDDPRRIPQLGAALFVAATHLDWSAWSQTGDGHWTYRAPRDRSLPGQGWKIHVSSTLKHASAVLDCVATHCHARSISFKHLADHRVLHRMNSKDADRTASGKFITVYPTTSDELEDTLEELERVLTGRPGPHVLSDLRWREAPVFVRYGAFQRLFMDVDGVQTPAMRHPSGELVPDIRETSFRVPPWVEVPPFLRNSLGNQQDSSPPDGFPVVTRALHHSNAGGVYEATDAGNAVALKEARPFAGLTPDGRDASERLADEEQVLRAIESARVVRAIRSFEVLDHRYLVTERAEGLPLSKAVIARHPLVRADPDESAVRSFRDWALQLAEDVDDAVSAVHDAGYTHGDLHPGNFIVADTGDVVLIDFEMARPSSVNAPGVIGAPGFVALDGRRGVALDRYAVACIKLFMFLPLTPLLDLHPPKAEQLIGWARDRFDLPSRWVDAVRADLCAAPSTSPPSPRTLTLDRHIAELSAQLVADATPERQDRLWPNDPAGMSEPAYAVAHGALGPLIALQAAGTAIPPELLAWAEHAVQASEIVRPGLLDGLAGAAVFFRLLGRAAASDDALHRLSSLNVDAAGSHFYGGLAGIGTAYVHLHEAHPSLLDRALNIADRLSHQRVDWSDRAAGAVATGSAGLMRGPSGIALFAIHLYDCTTDRALLSLAEEAIRADLRACAPTPDGALLVNEGWRLLPYLGSGSAGIACAIAALLTRSPDCELRDELDALVLAAQTEFVLEPGLFQGRAGLAMLLSQLGSDGFGTPARADALSRHLELFALHALPRAHGLGYPGRALLRRSCDLATGSAGILLTLATLRDPRAPSQLPLGCSIVPTAGPKEDGR